MTLNITALSGLFEWSQSLPAHIKLSYHGSLCKVQGSYAASPAAIVVMCCCGACEKKPTLPFRSGGSICSLQEWSLHVTLEPLVPHDLMVVQHATATSPVPFSLWLHAASLLMGGDKLKRKQLCVYWYDSVNQDVREPSLPSALTSPSTTGTVGAWRAATVIDFDARLSRFTVKYHTDHKKQQSYLYLPITLLHFARMPPAPGVTPRNVAEGFQPLPSVILQTPPTPPLAHLQLLQSQQQQQQQQQQQRQEQEQRRHQQLLLLSASISPTLPTAAQLQSTPLPPMTALSRPASKLASLTTFPLAAGAPEWSALMPVSAASMVRGTVAAATAATTATTAGWVKPNSVPSTATAAVPRAGSSQPQRPVPDFNSSPLAATTQQPQLSEFFSCRLGSTGSDAASSGGGATMDGPVTAFPSLCADRAPSLAGAMLSATVAAWQQQQQQQLLQQQLQQQQHSQAVNTANVVAADATVGSGFQTAHLVASASIASEAAATTANSLVSAGTDLPAATAASLAAGATGTASAAIDASACFTVPHAASPPHQGACIGVLSPSLPPVPSLQHSDAVPSSPLGGLLGQPPSHITSAPELDAPPLLELGPLPPVVQPVGSVATAGAATTTTTTTAISELTTNASWAFPFDVDSGICGWRQQSSPAPAAIDDAPTAAVVEPGSAAGVHGASYPSQLVTRGDSSSTALALSPERALPGQLLEHLAAGSTVTLGNGDVMDLYGKEAAWATAAAAAAAGIAGCADSNAGRFGAPPPSTVMLGAGLEDRAFLEEMVQFLSSECTAAVPNVPSGKHPCQSAPPTVTGFFSTVEDFTPPDGLSGGSAASIANFLAGNCSRNNSNNIHSQAAVNMPTLTPEGSPASLASEAGVAMAAVVSASFQSSSTDARFDGVGPVSAMAAAGAAAAVAGTMVGREEDERDDEAWASVRREVRRLENLCCWAKPSPGPSGTRQSSGGP
ncbi:hypothetical protein Vafri_8557 [Volvox africanus]|nr:hypothetical protein Vafri_8557 [Volvox africanus]